MAGHECQHVEMLFARLKRILRLGRLRLRVPGSFEFTLAAIAPEPALARQTLGSSTTRGWSRALREREIALKLRA